MFRNPKFTHLSSTQNNTFGGTQHRAVMQVWVPSMTFAGQGHAVRGTATRTQHELYDVRGECPGCRRVWTNRKILKRYLIFRCTEDERLGAGCKARKWPRGTATRTLACFIDCVTRNSPRCCFGFSANKRGVAVPRFLQDTYYYTARNNKRRSQLNSKKHERCVGVGRACAW